MPTNGLPWLLALSLVAASCLPEPILAQSESENPKCRVDEVDMGDYCAGLPPPRTEAEKDQRRITPFRSVGMMPGKVAAKTTQDSPSSKTSTPPDTVNSSGFGVQLGAFSSKEIALSVALSVKSPGTPVLLAPLERQQKVLWACILGPYQEQLFAQAVSAHMRKDPRFHNAWVKPLDAFDLLEAVHDTTEK